MDLTQKSEDEVSTALFDCDNDANRAVNYLLEGNQVGIKCNIICLYRLSFLINIKHIVGRVSISRLL